MRLNNLHRPFEIELLETGSYTAREHKNSYFEMVFILDGKGIQIINRFELPYSENKLFLIFPQDTHGFKVYDTTRFFILRFNEGYLKVQAREWLQKLEYIFANYNHLPGCILKNPADKPLIRSLVDALLRELQTEGVYHQDVVQQLINTFITVAARNIALAAVKEKYYITHSLSLLGYVQQNIYHPKALRAEEIASYFNLSPNYIGEYFKRETGESLQQYITNYKVALIEARLSRTDFRLGEIAAEFGFTDTSHLNKFFRKIKGISPSAYRKR
jgi:AraC-like DNA-binding protein